MFTPHTFAQLQLMQNRSEFIRPLSNWDCIYYVMTPGVPDVLEGRLLAYLDSGLSLEQQWQVSIAPNCMHFSAPWVATIFAPLCSFKPLLMKPSQPRMLYCLRLTRWYGAIRARV